jgi:hypothetical protein
MGFPEYEAERYEGHVKDGGILLSVHCDDSEWVGRAKRILEQTGAHDVSSAGEKAASSHGVDISTARHTKQYPWVSQVGSIGGITLPARIHVQLIP